MEYKNPKTGLGTKDLRKVLLKLIRIQMARVDAAYKEEKLIWDKTEEGKRILSSSLSKEMDMMGELVVRLFKVAGNKASVTVSRQPSEEEDTDTAPKEDTEDAGTVDEIGDVLDDVNALISQVGKKKT